MTSCVVPLAYASVSPTLFDMIAILDVISPSSAFSVETIRRRYRLSICRGRFRSTSRPRLA